MEPEFKAKVVDRDGKELGTVDHLVRDTWSGEIRKFVVRREEPEKDLFLTPEDIAEATKSQVNLNVTLEELNTR
jgi:sporulation protein YlmC with PRC-barrel domain